MPASVMDATRVRYSLKPNPYSSHTILLESLPEAGGGRRVLDLGCANGDLAALLSERGYRVTGVERPGGTDENFPSSVELIVADLDHGMPPIAELFDYVICADILEHLKDPGKVLRAIPRLLTPSGVLVASLPNSGNLYFRLNVLFGRFPQDDKGLFDRTHLHFYTWDGWVQLLESCGFRLDTVKPTGIPVGLGIPALADALPIKAAERLCFDLARVWKRLFAYQFVVVAACANGRGLRSER